MTTRVITRGTVYTTPPEVMPHYHYDTPKLSPRVKTCRDQQNEYRCRNSTAAAAHQVCESTTAYCMETSSMEVEEVQSRSASVVHRNGRNMSAAQTTAAVPGSIASFFWSSCTNYICASRCGGFHSRARRHSSHCDCCCGPHNSTGTGTRRCASDGA